MSESESAATSPLTPDPSRQKLERPPRRFEGSLRDTLIGGAALVVGAALGLGGTAYSAHTQSQSEQTLAHNGDVRSVCSAYTAVLVSSANAAMNLTTQMWASGGWTRKKSNAIIARLDDSMVPVITDLSNVLLTITSAKAEHLANLGINDYGLIAGDMEFSNSSSLGGIREDVRQVNTDALQFTMACRAELDEAPLPSSLD